MPFFLFLNHGIYRRQWRQVVDYTSFYVNLPYCLVKLTGLLHIFKNHGGYLMPFWYIKFSAVPIRQNWKVSWFFKGLEIYLHCNPEPLNDDPSCFDHRHNGCPCPLQVKTKKYRISTLTGIKLIFTSTVGWLNIWNILPSLECQKWKSVSVGEQLISVLRQGHYLKMYNSKLALLFLTSLFLLLVEIKYSLLCDQYEAVWHR